MEDDLQHPLLRSQRWCIMLATQYNGIEDSKMDFMRNIAGRDWAIGIVAFIAGAWIF